MNRRAWRSAIVVGYSLMAAACAVREPRVLLPDGQSLALRELTARYPLAAQPVRADRLGATERVSYHLVQVRPGAGEPPHLHASHDLVVTVLCGRGTQWLGLKSVPLQAGDSAVVPAGTPHRFVNTGSEIAVALVIFTPPHDGSDQVPVDHSN